MGQQALQRTVEVADKAGDLQRWVLFDQPLRAARERALADVEGDVAIRPWLGGGAGSTHHRVEQDAGLARRAAPELDELPAAGACDNLLSLFPEYRELRAGLVVLGERRY